MSYHSYNQMALGAAFGGGELECLNKANASPQVAGIDAIISNLGKTWHPTGYFRPADIQSVLAMLADEAAQAGAAVAAAPESTSDSREMKNQAFADMLRAITDRSKAYSQAIADASARGATAVNAPAFKDFVIKAMLSLSNAYVTATVLECRQGWVIKWLDKGYKAIASVGAVVARLGGVVVKIGENVVNAVDTAGSMLAFIIKWSPYAALGVGGWFLYSKLKKR